MEQAAILTQGVAAQAGAVSDFFSSIGLSGLSSLLSAVVVFVLCLIVIKIITKLTDKLFARSKHVDETVKRFLRTAIKIVLWILATVIIAGALGIPTASLVAVVSVAGLALSLSVQNILTNLFSGITLLLTRPISVGEYVEIGGAAGTVHSVGLFYTVIITPNRQVVTIPNSDVASTSITNYNREEARRVQFVFGADYADATADVRAALTEAAEAVPQVRADPAPYVFISAYKDSYIEYTMNVWCGCNDYWAVIAAVNENARESYDRHGVHMTYNHLNVHMIPEGEAN